MMKKIITYCLCVSMLVGELICGWDKIMAYAEDGSGVVPDGVAEVDDDETRPDDEAKWEPPRLYIKAVNPGYKIDGISNVGEMIELARGDGSDAPISLAGTAVGYTNSSGTYSTLLEFPENSWLTGEKILLRLASSQEHELAATPYTKTLAMTAGIELIVDGEIIDEVCWTGKTGCYKAFNSAKPTTLVRDVMTGEFSHSETYLPEYEAGNYREEETGVEDGKGGVAAPQCRGLRFSEILTYYEAAKSEQFIEFYNSNSGAITLDGCKLRYKNKNYVLSGTVEAEGYFVYYPVGFSLTKNPTNSNKLELIDADEAVVDTLEYPNGQRKGAAYALIGYDGAGKGIWKVTYAPTPGAPNNYQEFKTCEEGKVINEATGNCVKVTNTSEKVCKEGYYLNILTGRCKKLEDTTQKTCKEGYYLNPETNRCKKIVENKGADYSLEPENYEENSSFVALYAALGVMGIGAVYLIWEFRGEIAKGWQKLFRRRG